MISTCEYTLRRQHCQAESGYSRVYENMKHFGRIGVKRGKSELIRREIALSASGLLRLLTVRNRKESNALC